MNTDNILGHKGVLAKAYANLLNEFYGDGSSKNSFTPRAFKSIVSNCNSIFSSYGQQDSQEFLGWLLSGLEEDLNRVKVKPYIEKPDSTDEMVHNPEALRELADKCWKIYKARNDSVISDLFAGSYKSTVACPICDKVSIIFDPFNTFTLQLPASNALVHDIYYFPLGGQPSIVPIDIDQNSPMMALKEYVGKRFHSNPKNMIVAETYRSKLYKVFDETKTLGEERIGESDIIVVYELEDKPTNWPSTKKPTQKKTLTYHRPSHDEEVFLDYNTPQFDKMVVSVLHRKPASSSSKIATREAFGVPSFILVNREEACDYDAILRKVLTNVQAMTTTDILNPPSDNEGEDSDTFFWMKDEETDSSDTKIQTRSVDSEDGMIAVSKQDANEKPQRSASKPHIKERKQCSPLQSMLQPGSFIKPRLRELFDMQVAPTAGGDVLSFGLHNHNDDSRECTSLKDRLPKEVTCTSQKRSKKDRRLARLDNASSSDGEASIPDATLNDELGDDSSDELPPVQVLIPPSQADQSRFNARTHQPKRKIKTYSRKGIPASFDGTDEVHIAKDPLIRPGETIVLDWEENEYDRLFGGDPSDEHDSRGSMTDTLASRDENPELIKRKEKREHRRKYGVTLNDCLDEFGKPETLSENDAWYCPRCKTHRRATKTFELWKCPDILVIHLKRFSGGPSRLRDKLEIFVDFPVEGLDLTSRIAFHEEDREAIYDLFAVDNHYGGLGGGHYTAYAKSYYDDKWYEYNGKLTQDPSIMDITHTCRYPSASNTAPKSKYPRGLPFVLSSPFALSFRWPGLRKAPEQ